MNIWHFDSRNVLFCVRIYERKAAQLTKINCKTYPVIFSYSWTMLWSTCSIENLDWNGSVEFTLEALLKLLSVPKSLQGWLKTNKRLWKHCLVCYTKIPKNTGILFSKIPVSVFESNPGIPVFSGIPQGPAARFLSSPPLSNSSLHRHQPVLNICLQSVQSGLAVWQVRLHTYHNSQLAKLHNLVHLTGWIQSSFHCIIIFPKCIYSKCVPPKFIFPKCIF